MDVGATKVAKLSTISTPTATCTLCCLLHESKMLTILYCLPSLPYPSLITVAQGITKDFNLERGSRQSTQLEDILDDSDPDAQEAFRQEVNLHNSCPVYPLHVLYGA